MTEENDVPDGIKMYAVDDVLAYPTIRESWAHYVVGESTLVKMMGSDHYHLEYMMTRQWVIDQAPPALKEERGRVLDAMFLLLRARFALAIQYNSID